jgi:hypothetical protein
MGRLRLFVFALCPDPFVGGERRGGHALYYLSQGLLAFAMCSVRLTRFVTI